MPVPPFDPSGVIPPFLGANPGQAAAFMSPYVVEPAEVVDALSHSARRCEILDGWLTHRERLQNIGFDAGFQWLDGSFVENKDPNDLDVVTFLSRPNFLPTLQDLAQYRAAHSLLFDRAPVKSVYHLDFFPIDLSMPGPNLVNIARYWCGLFSHRRGDSRWKGMLNVTLQPQGNAVARLALTHAKQRLGIP